MKEVFWMSLLLVLCITFYGGCRATRTSTDYVGHPKYNAMCSKCHNLDRVDAVHNTISKEEMKTVIERMAKKPNSGIEESEIDNILNEIY